MTSSNLSSQNSPLGLNDAVASEYSAWSASLRWDTLTESSRRATFDELLDFVGDAIAGRAAVGMPPWLDVLLEDGGKNSASVAGGHRAAPWTAAMANAYFGHVLELDDTHDAAVLHAGASAIPAALAAAEFRGNVDAAALLAAMVVGIELNCRLGVATDLSLVEGGWIYTALLGHFGAAAAAARVLDCDETATRHALGIAYCFASGNHQSSREGAPTKHLQPGIAASNGLKAALMASRGLHGVTAPFQGEDGLARTYLHGRFDAARALRGLGAEFEIERLSIKPYPSCRLTHPAVSAALELRRRLGDDLNRVSSLCIRMGMQAHDVVGRAEPFRLAPSRWLDAQFSVFWTVAVALCHGAVTPAHLFREVPPGAQVRCWIERMRAEPMAGSASRDVGACELEATGLFGRVRVTAAQAKGHPDNPLSATELLDKFGANAELAGLTPDEAQKLAGDILTLDRAPDLSALVRALARRQPAHPAGGC
jgi:2-methylcitrate dehydratase PrpD